VSPSAKRMTVAMAIVLLAIFAAWNVSEVLSDTRRLRSDREDLQRLRRMLFEIDQVADAPRVAALKVESADEILNRINAALSQAGLPPSALASQTPGQPQRIGRSEFTLRKVEISLGAATVAQIVTFCDALKDESTGSVVRDVSLGEPSAARGRERWQSDLVLTQVIFDPKSPR